MSTSGTPTAHAPRKGAEAITRSQRLRWLPSLAAAVALIGCGGGGANCDGYRFDAGAWKATAGDFSKHDGFTKRQRLAKDAVRCGALIGMPKARVTRALGSPDERLGGGWSYLLGDERGSHPLDSSYLDLSFDANGRVAAAHVTGA